MSKANCQLYVDQNNRYCCTEKVICVDDCAYTLHVKGGPFPVLVYPTGDTDDGSAAYGETPAEGTMTIAEPGRYSVDLDCEALHGMPAPEDPALVCWEKNCINGLLELQILEKLCDMAEATGIDITPLCDKLEQLIDIMTEADFVELCEKLMTVVESLAELCSKMEAQAECLETMKQQDATFHAALLACMQEIKDGQTVTNEKLCDILGDPDAPCPDCPPQNPLTGKTVTYTNSDNETEMSVSVGGAGDIKIESGSGDGSDNEITTCIKQCLDAGLDVNLTWTTVPGDSGSAVLLAAAETNEFPSFYNQSTSAIGASGKIQTATMVCL